MCSEIAVYIGELVSPGIGEWDPAWEAVGPASVEFDALGRRWVREGYAGGYQEVEQAGIRLCEAWQRAEEAYQARGAND